MQFLELTVTVMLKRNIHYFDSGYIIGKNINKSMLLDEELKQIHHKKEYKNYVFNNFYPLEKEKIYIKDRLYVFKIRGLSYDFINKMSKCLSMLKSDDFKVVSICEKEIKQKYIKELYTMTPLIVTIDSKPWLQDDDLDVFKRRLEDNLEKKYKSFFNEEINVRDKFIKDIKFKNIKPMHFNYKDIKLIGNKVSIEVQDNEEAQKAAFLARATGLGEKNSAVGAGFCE